MRERGLVGEGEGGGGRRRRRDQGPGPPAICFLSWPHNLSTTMGPERTMNRPSGPIALYQPGRGTTTTGQQDKEPGHGPGEAELQKNNKTVIIDEVTQAERRSRNPSPPINPSPAPLKARSVHINVVRQQKKSPPGVFGATRHPARSARRSGVAMDRVGVWGCAVWCVCATNPTPSPPHPSSLSIIRYLSSLHRGAGQSAEEENRKRASVVRSLVACPA